MRNTLRQRSRLTLEIGSGERSGRRELNEGKIIKLFHSSRRVRNITKHVKLTVKQEDPRGILVR